MVTLPNIYTSDIRALLDWWKEVKDIEMIQQDDIALLMHRLEKELYNIQKGNE